VTAAGLRVPRARWIVIGAALIVCSALLWVTRNFTFYFDEWSFILTAPDWSVASYFEPHNEHPSMLLRVAYAVILNTVGLRSYLPYMALLYLAHFACVVLLFELVRRRSGDGIALAAAAILLVLGAGWEDLYWAWQMAWLGSVACGLGALLAVQEPGPRRLALAVILLAASVSFSGVGIPFVVAVGIYLSLIPARRRELLALTPLAAGLLAWYVLFGRFGEHPNPQPDATNLLRDPVYVAWGLSQSAGGLIGVTGNAGVVVLIVALALLVLAWRVHRPDATTIGVAVGLIGFYAVAGLTRAQLGIQQSGASRYIYPAAAMWLLVVADAARALPWRGTWRPALAACAFLACFNNAVVLYEFGVAKTVQMERAAADLQALTATRNDPCLDPNARPDLLVMPDAVASTYYRAVDHYGDPASGRPLEDRGAYDAARTALRKPGCH